MMKAVEWLREQYDNCPRYEENLTDVDFSKAKEMEKKEKAKKQLFIGKVSEIIGVEKTIELLKEVNNEIR